MALNITPGPLPEDGTRIKIATVLSDFVGGTQITDFGEEDFTAAQITFVQSSTEAPATKERGSLWYKRGEGVLYKWEIFPTPTNETAVTNGAWVAFGGRRDQLVKQMRTTHPDEILTPSSDASTYRVELNADGRYTPRMQATGSTNTVHILDPVLISLDSGATYAPAVEFGFTTCKVTGTGAFGYVRPSTVAPTFRMYLDGATAWTNTMARVAAVSTSDSTDGERTLTVYKYPSLTNTVRT